LSSLALKLHPHSRCAAVTSIDVDVARERASRLVLTYSVSGTIDEVLMPPPAEAARSDELWRHTCFEAFVRPLDGEAYYEFNFAPSAQWAAYRFDGYRNGMCAAGEIRAPQIVSRTGPEYYTLQVALEFGGSSLLDGRALGVGLSAVIEETNGQKSYWALAHPPGKPDFHHADCFALQLSER
jgi:hypothetical protein